MVYVQRSEVRGKHSGVNSFFFSTVDLGISDLGHQTFGRYFTN